MSENRDTGTPALPRREGADALAEALIETLARDFEKHGATVIGCLRESDPKSYLAVVSRFVPPPEGRGMLVVNTLIDLGGQRD